MTIAFRDSATGTGFNAAASVTIPSTVQVGDFLVLVWGSFYPPSGDPSGWTRLSLGTATGGPNQYGFGCWYKFAAGGDAGSVVTVTGTPTPDKCALIVGAWSGVASVRATAATIGSAGVSSGGTFSSPTVSATSGDTVISVFGVEGGSGAPTLTYDAAVTVEVERAFVFPRVGETDEVVSSTGTTTARTASPNDSVSWGSATIALVPFVPKTGTDSAPATDAVARLIATLRTGTDSAPSTDRVGSVLLRTASDSAGATDSASGLLTRIRATASFGRSRGWGGAPVVSVPASLPTGVGYEVNGRERGFDAVAVVTTDPAPLPVHAGYLRTRQETYPAPVIIAGQAYLNSSKDPWVPSSVVTGLWGKFDIIIGGINVTYFRNDARGNPIETIVERLTDKDPGGDDVLELRFPGVTTWDHPGTGDLTWMYPDAPVTVRKVNSSGVVVGTVYEGVVGPLEDNLSPPTSGAPVSSTVLHCTGIWGRLDDFITLPRPSIDQYLRPIPVGHMTPIDSAQFVYAHVHRAQLYGWPGKMVRPANSGILTGEQGAYGDPIASRTLQNVLAQMQTSTDVYTVGIARPRKLVVKTRTWDVGHVDFTLRAGQRGETHNLTLDPTEAHNAFYGQGQAPFGPVDPALGRPDSVAAWANWQYPFAIAAIPAYPLPVGQDFVAGDGHTGFAAFSDELNSHGYKLDSGNTYLTSDVDEIERFQSNSGIQVDGIVGPQTWNQAFQTGVNTKVLASAYIKEIYTGSAYSPFKTNSRGGIVGPNPDFDPLHHPRREVLEQYGSSTKAAAAKSARHEFSQIRTPIYRGTVTATNIDPPEMCALDTRAGMTMVLKNHKGVDRRLYVSQVERLPGMSPQSGSDRRVTWTVSELPEGLMTTAQRLARNLGIRDLVASNRPPRHHARNIQSWPAFDAESGAGILPPGQAQTGGLWNKYLIPMGGQVDVSAVKLVADRSTKMAAAMFANPYLTVEKLIALSGLANPSVGTEDPWALNQDTLLDYGICWATGNPNGMQGYWPNDPGTGGLTGVLADTSPWQFRANSVWGALFVWTQSNCAVSGDPANKYRAIFPAPVT